MVLHAQVCGRVGRCPIKHEAPAGANRVRGFCLLVSRRVSAIYGTLYGMVKRRYVDPDTVLALRQMAETQGRSQAELIRDALETYTKATKRPLPRGLGKDVAASQQRSKRQRFSPVSRQEG